MAWMVFKGDGALKGREPRAQATRLLTLGSTSKTWTLPRAAAARFGPQAGARGPRPRVLGKKDWVRGQGSSSRNPSAKAQIRDAT